jgi:hypothetical protein
VTERGCAEGRFGAKTGGEGGIAGDRREREGEGRGGGSGAEDKAQRKGKKRKREERWTCPLTVDSLRSHSPPCRVSAGPARERLANGWGTSWERMGSVGNAPGRLGGRGYLISTRCSHESDRDSSAGAFVEGNA